MRPQPLGAPVSSFINSAVDTVLSATQSYCSAVRMWVCSRSDNNIHTAVAAPQSTSCLLLVLGGCPTVTSCPLRVPGAGRARRHTDPHVLAARAPWCYAPLKLHPHPARTPLFPFIRRVKGVVCWRSPSLCSGRRCCLCRKGGPCAQE